MSISTSASNTARTLSVAATAAAASVSPKDFAAMAKSLVQQFSAANAEKGDRKVRAIDACKVFGASLLTEVLASGNADSIRISVCCITKERGHDVVSTVTLQVTLILKAIVFGGNLVGATRLHK